MSLGKKKRVWSSQIKINNINKEKGNNRRGNQWENLIKYLGI